MTGAGSSRTTIVTSLFDVATREGNGARRSVEEYLRLGAFVLRQPCPLVVACDPELAGTIQRARAMLAPGAESLVMTRPLEQTRSYARLSRVEEARRRNPVENANPDKDTPLYTVCMHEKFVAIEEVARTNPFGSERIAWVDFGIAHVADVTHADADRIFEIEAPGVRVLQLSPWHPAVGDDLREYARWFRGLVATGFLLGPRDAMASVASLAETTIEHALERMVALNDEQAFALVMSGHRDRFAPYYGDYRDILQNARTARGGDVNIAWQIGNALRLRDWRGAAAIGRWVHAGIDAGTFRAEPERLSDILHGWFVAAWHAEYPAQREATEAARAYAALAARDAEFRAAFESRRASVLADFALLDAREELGLGG